MPLARGDTLPAADKQGHAPQTARHIRERVITAAQFRAQLKRNIKRYARRYEMSTADMLTFIGRYHPGTRRVWVATGFGHWGMSNGTLAGLVIRDLITGEENPLAGLYEPTRQDFMALPQQTITVDGQQYTGVSLATIAEQAGVPVLGGSQSAIRDTEQGKRLASKLGFPVILKAAKGGGGRGMRVVQEAEGFVAAYEEARRESLSAFGSPDIFVEKFIEKARHIEVQLLGDRDGNLVHLFERELRQGAAGLPADAPPELRHTDAAVGLEFLE
jgi:hypothetical protein